MSKTDPSHSIASNAYLKLAYQSLMFAKRPLSPIEILEVAAEQGFMPSHLHGSTMYKTLSARLAEHIREKNNHSVFFRTGPAKFYLHSLASQPNTPEAFTKVFVGHLRSKSIRKENVLVIPKEILEAHIYGEFTPYNENGFQELYKKHCLFVDRPTAENDPTLKQFVTFTLVIHNRSLLVYRRGKFTSTSDALKGQRSVGFGGHVSDEDFDLFNAGGEAFRNNAARELKEELFLDSLYRERSDAAGRTKVLGYVNVDDTPDAQHHIAILVAFFHNSPEVPKKGELSINQLSWLDTKYKLNDLSDFDLWSGLILKNIYNGKIGVD